MKTHIKLSLFAAFFLCMKAGFAQMTGWKFRKPIYISQSNNSSLVDFQVRISINTAALINAGKMQTDAGDLRFTDASGNTVYKYWIESGINSSNTLVWVKIPLLNNSGANTMMMYYGNPMAADLSSGDNTFVFYDDFGGDASVLNPNKWTESHDAGVNQAVFSGKYNFSGQGYGAFTSVKLGVTAPFVVHTRVSGYSAYSWDLSPVGYAREDGTFSRLAYFSGLATRYGQGINKFGFPGSINPTTPITSSSCDSILTFESTVFANGSCQINSKGAQDYVPAGMAGVVSNATRITFHYYYNPGNAGGTCSNGRSYDEVFVRKYAAISPLVDSIGAEQNLSALGRAENPAGVELKLYPNPAKDHLFISVNGVNGNEFSYSIMDVQGKIYLSGQVQQSGKIEWPHLVPGIYLLNLSNQETSLNSRITIQ